MLTAGSCATRTYEPCQVRKEAALSKHLRVPWERLVRANCLGTVRKVQFGDRCMTFNLQKTRLSQEDVSSSRGSLFVCLLFIFPVTEFLERNDFCTVSSCFFLFFLLFFFLHLFWSVAAQAPCWGLVSDFFHITR